MMNSNAQLWRNCHSFRILPKAPAGTDLGGANTKNSGTVPTSSLAQQGRRRGKKPAPPPPGRYIFFG
ncbi:hypothetical protein, partial [Rothia aeria]|uniref:hypothetical protein n=1 Tax=Rothia aeria TaxID=172042 RepID=UPI00244BB8B4